MAQLLRIRDRRIRQQLGWRIERLAEDPLNQGKPLGKELAGYRSVRAAAQKYRIIFRVHESAVEVLVVAVGLRREGSHEDVYSEIKRRLKKRKE